MERPRLLAISAVWFFALGGLGLFFPFYSLYLKQELGFSGGQIGQVMACLPLVGIAVQPLVGRLADRSGSRSRLLVVLALGAGGGYTALALGESFPAMLGLTAALACFSTPLIPNAVAVTLAVTRAHGPHAFGLARTWGTVGFLIAVVSFPSLLDALASRSEGGPSLRWMFPLTGAVVGTAGLVALALPRAGEVALRAVRGDWRPLLAHPPYWRLLVFAFLAYGTLQGPMSFFPVYVTAHGGTLETVSRLWVPMLLVEIPLVALSGASLARLGARGLLGLGVAAGGLRWLVCGFWPDSPLVFPLQGLHGVVVAGLVIGAPLYVEATVPERQRSTAQGLLAMVGASLGGIASNLACGFLLERYGTDAPYQISGIAALALGALLPLLLPRPHRPRET